jgi:hypothetical protein
MARSLTRGRAIIIAALILLGLLFESVPLVSYSVQGDTSALPWLVGVPLLTCLIWAIAWRGATAARRFLVCPLGALAVFAVGVGSLVCIRFGISAIGAGLVAVGLLAAGAGLLVAFSPDVGHYLRDRRIIMHEGFLPRPHDRNQTRGEESS